MLFIQYSMIIQQNTSIFSLEIEVFSSYAAKLQHKEKTSQIMAGLVIKNNTAKRVSLFFVVPIRYCFSFGRHVILVTDFKNTRMKLSFILGHGYIVPIRHDHVVH